MVFGYLHIGKYMAVDDFLKHIDEIGHLELPAGSTFTHLAEGLREKYKNDEKRLSAVNTWIELNIELNKDLDPNTQPILEQDSWLTYNFKKG